MDLSRNRQLLGWEVHHKRSGKPVQRHGGSTPGRSCQRHCRDPPVYLCQRDKTSFESTFPICRLPFSTFCCHAKHFTCCPPDAECSTDRTRARCTRKCTGSSTDFSRAITRVGWLWSQKGAPFFSAVGSFSRQPHSRDQPDQEGACAAKSFIPQPTPTDPPHHSSFNTKRELVRRLVLTSSVSHCVAASQCPDSGSGILT